MTTIQYPRILEGMSARATLCEMSDLDAGELRAAFAYVAARFSIAPRFL
jgi:hypothetical protein